MGTTIPISVAIVTQNEEGNIQAALESVKDFRDIVIVDALSEDRTVEICKRYTDRVFQHHWQGYSKQKQLSVNYTEGPWVLILDSDERVTPGLKTEMAEKTRETSLSGFHLPRRNFFLGRWMRHSGWWPDYTLRLFRKEVSYVEDREVHEKVIVKGPVGYLKEPIEHYTYRTISDFVKKMENYSTLSAREICSGCGVPLMRSLVVNPALVFFKMFLLRQGYRDGMHGFILAVLYSFHTFLKYAKVWEKRGG